MTLCEYLLLSVLVDDRVAHQWTERSDLVNETYLLEKLQRPRLQGIRPTDRQRVCRLVQNTGGYPLTSQECGGH